jgi:hypothetical protein
LVALLVAGLLPVRRVFLLALLRVRVLVAIVHSSLNMRGA